MEFIRSAGRFQAFRFANYRRFRSNSGGPGAEHSSVNVSAKNTRIINSFYNKHSPITSNAWGVSLSATWGIEGIICWLYSGPPGQRLTRYPVEERKNPAVRRGCRSKHEQISKQITWLALRCQVEQEFPSTPRLRSALQPMKQPCHP